LGGERRLGGCRFRTVLAAHRRQQQLGRTDGRTDGRQASKTCECVRACVCALIWHLTSAASSSAPTAAEHCAASKKQRSATELAATATPAVPE
jgi:hypothetical protein